MPGRKQQPLGTILVRKKRADQRGRRTVDRGTLLHTTELNDGYDWGRLNLRSVTERSSLNEFLETARLAEKEFEAEKCNVKLVTSTKIEGILSSQEKQDMEHLQNVHKDELQIPRRPQWTRSMTVQELTKLENTAFLDWRRSLSHLSQVKGLVLTPYEQNLEFWRQLWRVIEKSDVVVQIVDARNPLAFYCANLDTYVKDVGKDKIPVLLVNKADYLTPEQCKTWRNYFDSEGIRALFFSAASETKRIQQEIDTAEDDAELDEKENIPDEMLTREELIAVFKSLHTGEKVQEGVTTVGLIGYPNVGKSSTINCILMDKKVAVSKTPGKTKHYQTLYVDRELLLCDCPGLVMPSFASSQAEMVLNGILPIDDMRSHVPPVSLLATLIPRHILEQTYGIHLPYSDDNSSEILSCHQLLDTYARMRGYMSDHGKTNNPRAARYILKDFVSGKLLYCVAPPGVCQEEYHIFPAREESTYVPLTQDSFSEDFVIPLESLTLQDFEIQDAGRNTQHYKGVHGRHTYPTKFTSSVPQGAGAKKQKNKKKDKLRRVYKQEDS